MTKRSPKTPQIVHYSGWYARRQAFALRLRSDRPTSDTAQIPVDLFAAGPTRLRHMLIQCALVAVCAVVLASTLLAAPSSKSVPQHAALSVFAPKKPAVHQPKPLPAPKPTVKPLANLGLCPFGTVLTAVAHQDDDILFMNPALQHEINAGMCVRTVYLTAGDDGHGANYWQRRELGPDAAYATMAGVPDDWLQTTTVAAGHTLSVHALVGKPQISLVFMRLPDGNLAGQGFASTGYESLQKLRDGDINAIHSIDGNDTYTREQLVDTIKALIKNTKPDIINTQAFETTTTSGDHSDHQAVGYFTSLAGHPYHNHVSFHRYIGYQSGLMPVNLNRVQAAAKQTIFDAYEHDDLMICGNTDDCSNGFIYQHYISRQYEQIIPGTLVQHHGR